MKTRILFAAVAASILTLAQDAQAQWWNPVVGENGHQTTVVHNPFTSHTHVHEHKNQFHASYFDAGRNQVAPGSVRKVNQTFVGADGALYRQQGYTWRSAVTGREHGNVTTVRLGGGSINTGFGTVSTSQGISSAYNMQEPTRSQSRTVHSFQSPHSQNRGYRGR